MANDTSKKTTTYVPGVFIKEKTFNDGYILKVGVNVDKLVTFLNQNKNEKGYVNIDIKPRREEGTYGDTHSAVLDTYAKDGGNSGGGQSSNANKPTNTNQRRPQPAPKPQQFEDEDDQIPF